MAVARQAQGLTGENQRPEEANFVLETFRSAVGQLQAQRSELERLNAQVTARADSAEKMSAHIVASVPSGLVAFDAQGRVTLLNAPARLLLEAPENATGMSARFLLRQAPNLLELVEDSLNYGALRQREEITLRHSGNGKRRLGASVGPLETANGRGALCLFTDLTEVTQLREQVALKKNLENLGEMSAGLAHEFKNALAALQSYAQLLQNNDLPEQGRVAAAEMLTEVRHLSDMITSFLNFARPQPLQLCETNLRELLDDCAEELSGVYSEKQVQLEISGHFPDVQADEMMLRQALLNLLRNAVEAIEPEQPVRRVTVRGSLHKPFKARPASVVLTIQDTGTGLSGDDLERVFIPFFTTKAKGHGIGLALAHRVITQHGGSLTVSNGTPGGAVFKVVLPLN
jgi:signal transduction histidine kinase